jgi:electron transfer flavoprotein beta subunit
MADVLVCVKRVVDSSGEVVLTEDGQAVDGRFAGFTVSAHEECAVELAVQVAAATEGTAGVMTLGDADAVELRDHEAAGRPHDLVLLGNDAADSGDFQVGIRLAYELGRPVVNGAAVVRVEDGAVVAEVAGPDGHETYRVPLPAVVTVLEGGVEPRYPSVPGRMKAKKVEIEQRTPAAEPTGPKRVKLALPPPQPSNVQILGKGPEAAPAVVDLFERLGVLAR